MNIILKASSTAALILMLGGNAVNAYAQRCASDLTYLLRNKKGEIIDEEKIGLRDQRQTPPGSPAHVPRPPTDAKVITLIRPDEHTDSVTVLRFETLCGLRLAEVELQHENQTMVLRFHNIPGDTDFFVDSVAFQEGTFEIDFQNDRRLKNQKLNRDGVRSKEGKYLLRGTAQRGYLVSAENWVKAYGRKPRL